MQKKLILLLVLFIVSSGIGGTLTHIFWEGKYTKLELLYSEKLVAEKEWLLLREQQKQDITSLRNDRDLAIKASREVDVQYIEKEIIVYEQADNDSDCVLDDDWVRIYNESRPRSRAP